MQVVGFDELNTIRVKHLTSSLYDRLSRFNEKEFRSIVRGARAYALALLDKDHRSKVGKFDPDEIIEYYLATYNFVTGYLYKPETERKRLRTAEEIMTAREYLDRERYAKVLKRSADLWYTQASQYSIGLEDETCIRTWKEAGVPKVQWVTQKDERVCSYCHRLNGKTFDIDKAPKKAHYNCRCYLIPVWE